MDLRSCYAMTGTEIPYGATRRARLQREGEELRKWAERVGRGEEEREEAGDEQREDASERGSEETVTALKDLVTTASYLWASGTVSTRSCKYEWDQEGGPERERVGCLVPVMDLLNHASYEAAECKYCDQAQAYQVRPPVLIPPVLVLYCGLLAGSHSQRTKSRVQRTLRVCLSRALVLEIKYEDLEV